MSTVVAEGLVHHCNPLPDDLAMCVLPDQHCITDGCHTDTDTLTVGCTRCVLAGMTGEDEPEEDDDADTVPPRD